MKTTTNETDSLIIVQVSIGFCDGCGRGGCDEGEMVCRACKASVRARQLAKAQAQLALAGVPS